jgi:peptide/nickel transport system substrate-binding protein
VSGAACQFAAPQATRPDGSSIANPLRDVRVRRVLSVAINREALCDRILQGQGVPAGDLGPDRYFGTSPNLTPQPFGTRRLPAEAGYAQDFAVQVDGPNDRFPNDEQIVQAIAQMWSRIGLVATVETRPRGVWLSEAAQLKYSVNFAGFSPTPKHWACWKRRSTAGTRRLASAPPFAAASAIPTSTG